MRCLLISDIHANLPALEAVMRDASERGAAFDIVWCLGDVVGYGPDPNECIEMLRTFPHVCLVGNHDWAVLGKLELDTFNEQAASIAVWTRNRLAPPNMAFLQSRPEVLPHDDYYLVHASPREPIWEYVTDVAVAEDNFYCFDTQFCLCGHTHVPAVFVMDERKSVRLAWPTPNVAFRLRPELRYIINPGGVGQPRDGDPRAAYAVLDTAQRTLTYHRVEYDVRATQDRMRRFKFPERMIERLAFGR